jgi:MYXO-CTERM domain-containing protein
VGLKSARADRDLVVERHRMGAGASPLPAAALAAADGVVLAPDGEPLGGCQSSPPGRGRGIDSLPALLATLGVLWALRRRPAPRTGTPAR